MDVFNTHFLPMLLGWSVAWASASVIGGWATAGRGFWRSFWFMSGLWAAVNIAIGVVSLINPPADLDEFRNLLLINAGLDIGYLIAATVLLTRRSPMLKGFGAGVAIQGLFLLVFDLVWWAVLG